MDEDVIPVYLYKKENLGHAIKWKLFLVIILMYKLKRIQLEKPNNVGETRDPKELISKSKQKEI